jgi:hypothetical protein
MPSVDVRAHPCLIDNTTPHTNAQSHKTLALKTKLVWRLHSVCTSLPH